MRDINKNTNKSRGGFSFPLSDEATPITTGVKYTDSLVYNLELTEVFCKCTVAPTTTTIIVDMLKNGVSILTNKMIIPIGAKSSLFTTTPSVINNSTILSSDIISFEVIQGDAAGAGLKVQGKGWELNDRLV